MTTTNLHPGPSGPPPHPTVVYGAAAPVNPAAAPANGAPGTFLRHGVFVVTPGAAHPSLVETAPQAEAIDGWTPIASSLFDGLSDLLLLTDATGRVLRANAAFVAVTGSTAVGRSWSEFFHADDAAELVAALAACGATSQQPATEVRVRRADASWLVAGVTVRPFPVTGNNHLRLIQLRDFTERHSLETQCLRAQRLQNIGVLTGGIAHDLNNVLTPVVVCLEALRHHPPGGDAGRLVPLADRAAQRAVALVQQILAFARGSDGQPAVIRPRELVGELRALIAETFPKSIRFEESVPEQLWNLRGSATGLHQVLLNLCVNACDAMPEGGVLRLSVENAALAAGDPRLPAGFAPGRYVTFCIADTGTGMSSQVTQRIFDPFFTTKSPGKGTGIGLSTSLGIVKKHEGFFQVTSEPGLGSQFRVFIPAWCETVAERLPEPVAHEVETHSPGEVVLVVDDEPLLRSSMRMVLEHHGYRVLTAGNGQEALSALAQHGNGIRVVITDLVMPETDGLQLIETIRRRYPATRVIVSSGFPPTREMMARLGPSVATLAKPFDVRLLVHTLQDSFQAAAAAAGSVARAA